MSRIRSIHPGFFTDEDLVSVSMAARLLIIGLGIEADDKGVFEWKPLTLKMKIFPADNVNVSECLSELEAVNAIRSYEIDGRKYGAIRNFRRFQRPKTPNDVHPIPDDFRNYVGLETLISEPFLPKGENGPQMEDGGGRKKDEGKKEVAAAASKKEDYAFVGKTIRLTKADYDRWCKAYHAIPDFEADLTSLDAWLQGQPEAKRQNWFQSVAGSLNRNHQKILTERNRDIGDDGQPFIPYGMPC